MFVSGNSFEISSFYTVYDYDDLAANVKSFSFRQVSFLDTTLFQFTGHLSSTLRVSYKYSEQAMLFWHRFAVQPLRNIEEIFLHPALRAHEGNFVFAIGYRYMSLTTYKYDQSIRKRETVFRNHGPSAFLSYVIGSQLRVQVDGWLESITRSGGQTLRESNFTVLLLYKL
jgi:hypothetical protein